MLLFDGLNFLQVLEGRFTPITTLMETIAEDARHHKIVTLIKEPIAEREYSMWSMKLLRKDRQTLTLIEDTFEVLLEQKRDGLKQNNSKSRSALIAKAFMEGAWTGSESVNESAISILSGHYLPKKLENSVNLQQKFAFQPIIDVRSRQVMWVEALIRGPKGESPMSIFDELDDKALHKLDAQSKLDALKVFSQFDTSCGLSLNLLPGTLLEFPDIVEDLAQLADNLGVKRSGIVIELTEQEAIENPDHINRLANEIKAKGFLLAIDDFGSGYAGLSILVELQPHILKIDRGIIQGAAQSGPREAIIDAIIYCAKRLGISIIAEGVEKEEDLSWLFTAGIERFQGYLLAKPALMALPPIHGPKNL